MIAQRLLAYSDPTKFRDGPPALKVEDEIESLHFGHLPLLAGRKDHVYLTPSDLSFTVRCYLRHVFAKKGVQCSISAANLEDAASAGAEREQAIAASCALVMPLSDSIMLDERVQADLRFAQQSGTKVIMLHMHQVHEGPEDNTFAQIMGNCPDDISGWLVSAFRKTFMTFRFPLANWRCCCGAVRRARHRLAFGRRLHARWRAACVAAVGGVVQQRPPRRWRPRNPGRARCGGTR